MTRERGRAAIAAGPLLALEVGADSGAVARVGVPGEGPGAVRLLDPATTVAHEPPAAVALLAPAPRVPGEHPPAVALDPASGVARERPRAVGELGPTAAVHDRGVTRGPVEPEIRGTRRVGGGGGRGSVRALGRRGTETWPLRTAGRDHQREQRGDRDQSGQDVSSQHFSTSSGRFPKLVRRSRAPASSQRDLAGSARAGLWLVGYLVPGPSISRCKIVRESSRPPKARPSADLLRRAGDRHLRHAQRRRSRGGARV